VAKPTRVIEAFPHPDGWKYRIVTNGKPGRESKAYAAREIEVKRAVVERNRETGEARKTGKVDVGAELTSGKGECIRTAQRLHPGLPVHVMA